MGRLLLAHALRLIVVVSIALAAVIALITAVGAVLAATDAIELAEGYGVVDISLMAAVVVTLMLSVARLAHVILARIVDLRRDSSRG